MENERIYLLPKGNYYKANLHCHTTCSDGKFTPEEIKKLYMQKGYSIVAFSDHHNFVQHNDLTDKDFVALNAVEISLNQKTENREFVNLQVNDDVFCWSKDKTHHINFIAKNKDTANFIEYDTEYSTNNMTKMIAGAKKDFMAVYNHPRWSMQPDTAFINLWDLMGIEVFNNSVDKFLLCGETEYEYDCFLRAGGVCFPIAADDNHKIDDMFGGFQLIKCDELNYENVTAALEKGDHYASMGPLFKDLYIENGKLHISCTPCMRVAILTETRNRTSKESKELIDEFTEIDLPLPKFDKFIRIYLIDSKGNKALTRAYIKGVDL